MNPDEVLAEELELLEEDLIKSYDSLGLRASGEWVKQLDSFVLSSVSKLVGRVVGAKYTTQLVKGRRPGTMLPSKAIEAWIRVKGIKAKDRKMSIKQLAFAIAMSIKKKGTKIFQKGGTDLIESVITPARVASIIEKVGESVLRANQELLLNQARKILS